MKQSVVNTKRLLSYVTLPLLSVSLCLIEIYYSESVVTFISLSYAVHFGSNVNHNHWGKEFFYMGTYMDHMPHLVRKTSNGRCGLWFAMWFMIWKMKHKMIKPILWLSYPLWYKFWIVNFWNMKSNVGFFSIETSIRDEK